MKGVTYGKRDFSEDMSGSEALGVSLEAIRQELERVLASRAFTNANRGRRFLQFVVEESICGRADQLKEYMIGAEAFDRGDDFDPRSDSVVRVEARRLRARLEEYYKEEGKDDPLRIELPKGTYAPVFQPRITDPETPATPRRRPWIRWALAGAAVVAIILAIALWPRGPSAPLYDSIAVLPFVNLTPSSENEYFCDGLVDEITLTLSRIRGMRVAARTSAFQFKERDEDVREIGRQLNVSTVIEGSVRQMDSQLRVTAQLISTVDGFHLWAQTYDCNPAETFAVQEQISRDIARTLAIQWSGDSTLVRQHSADPAARAHYLRGRYFWNKRTAGDIRTAIGEFEEAIEIDPSYALAHAALADAHAVLAFNDQAPLAESVNQARSAALRALELDDNLAEAHAVLAWILVFHDWEWEEGERLFRHALDLNPNYSTGHQWYGLSLLPRRHFREALAQFRQAELLDPLSLIVSTDIGVTYYYSHQYQQAVEQADATLRMDPDFFLARLLRGAALVELDRTSEALPELEEAVELSDRFTDAVMRLAHANAVAGRPDRAHELLAELIETARSGDSSCYQVASVYAGLEDREAVWEWLGQAVDKHEAAVAFLDVDPIFDNLRDLPEFRNLLRRIHLED